MADANSCTRSMTILTTKEAALRFKQNWLAHNPPELHSDSSTGSNSCNLDDSLTSLNWLQNLRIMRIQQPTPPSSPTPLSSMNRNTNPTLTIPNKTFNLKSCPRLNSAPSTCEEAKALFRTSSLHHSQPPLASIEQVDYTKNQFLKPPYSYATLIWMAMKDSKKNKITLSAIYKWITDNFKYYQDADPSWQNSIRHNLSLNKCFQKVPRRKDEPGKGGFWRIDPAHVDFLENGIFKKRRNTTSVMDFIPKRIKIEPVDDYYENVFDDANNNSMMFHYRKQSTPRKHSLPLQLNGKQDPVLEASTLPSHILKDDYTWNTIFNSEIEVEGMKIKTEDILDDEQDDVESRPESPLLTLSPQPSEVNEDGQFCPERIDLDLSINGVSIPRPQWFEDQLKDLELNPLQDSEEDMAGLFGHFNFPPSPAQSLNDQQEHPWAEKGQPLRSFEVDDLFDFTNMPAATLPWENNA